MCSMLNLEVKGDSRPVKASSCFCRWMKGIHIAYNFMKDLNKNVIKQDIFAIWCNVWHSFLKLTINL